MEVLPLGWMTSKAKGNEQVHREVFQCTHDHVIHQSCHTLENAGVVEWWKNLLKPDQSLEIMPNE